MPSTRPRAQGNSRPSAKPTSPFIPASSTPTFLPPSHYAAAAGISYQTVRDHAPSQDSYYSGAQPSLSMTRSSMAPSGRSTYIPITMPSPPPESVSFSPDHGQSKRSFLKRRPSRSDTTMSRNSSNRQSQLGDLPMVEAQLLPSLRDTIDKMTNTSKAPGDPSSPNSLPLHRDLPSNRLSLIHASSPSPSRPLSNSLRRPAATPKSTPISPMPSTPKPASGLNAGRSPRIPVATSKVKPKPILKSVFSGSSSTTMAGSSKVPEPSSPSKLSQSKPSRLVKGVLGKKPARGTPETSSVSTTHKTAGSIASFSFRDHGRSRTDPGSTSKIPSRSPHLSRTPQAMSSYSSSHSHPMPANCSQRNVKHPGASSGESGPELELRSERGRALVVTNADIIASSSESSSEIDGDQVADDILPEIQPAWMRPATMNAYTMSRPRASQLPDGIGLGLGVPEAHVREPYDARRGNRRSSTNRSRGEDETSVYLDGEAWETVDVSMDSAPYSGTKNKFHREREMAYANRSSSSALPNPWEAGDGMLEDSVRRRHDALMGIVNELEIGLSTNDGKRDSEDSFESEYMGQEGLAISGSTDIQSQTVSSGESFGAHHGRQRSIARPSPQSRQRSHAYSPNAHAVDAKSPSASYGTPRWSHYPNNQRNALVTLATTNHEDSGQDDEISASEYASEDGEDDDFHFEEVTPTISGSLRQSRPYSAASRSRTSTESPSRLAKPSRANNLALSPINTSLRPSRRSVVDSRAPTASTSLANDRHQRDSVSALKRRSRHNDDGPYIPSDASVYSTGERFISETYSHHQSMNFVEAREREAFGLPPSVSNDSDIISHAQSVSSLDIRRCQDEGDEFSSGAEAIFKKLSYEADPHYLEETPGFRGDGEGHVHGTHDYEDVPMSGEDSVINVHPSQTQTTLSRSSSANSIYEDCTPARSWQHHQQDPHILDQNAEGCTWRSTLPSSAHRSLLERYGEMEMERQEIIWEICESEETFVKRLRVVVELFIRPLRLQNSRSWISGVPPDIARLFDWLEDIVNLHSQLFAALRVARAGQYPLVMRIAEVLRGFVPRLEVHQPYLVRIDEVVAMIKMMTGENGDDFGEFIRIQEERVCQGWSLETVLLEPVSRLSQYPMRFKRLWDATPQTHLDHISTFSLLHSSETMIRVMREVRIREEEYDLVKDIMNRIEGLPPSVQLASRERRLLARGRLLRISGNDKIRGTRGANPVYPSFAGTPASTRDRSVQRQSRLLNALQGWKASSGARSDSLRSMTSSNFSADSGLTVASSTPPITPMSLGHDVASISRSGKWSGSSPGTSRRYDLSTGSASPWNDPAKHSPIHVFVFTDLVVLASPAQRASRARAANGTSNLTADNGVEKETWRLLSDIGICRILGIAGEEQNIALDLLPMDTEDLETGVIPDSVPVASVTLTIPPSSSSGKVFDSASLEDISAKWLSAFQQCFQYTLRSLSFPSHSGKYLAQGPNVDLDLDSRQSVMAILASGLPLPKSPSIQIEETMLGISGSIEQQEREERGWWSLRFQQVLKEMQRNDLSFAEAPGSLASRSMSRAGPSRSLSSISQPRRLRLPSMASLESAVMSTPVAANRSRLG